MWEMVRGKTFANAAMQPAEPDARPPMRKSDCPPKVAKVEAGKAEERRVILPTWAQVSLVPTMFYCFFNNFHID